MGPLVGHVILSAGGNGLVAVSSTVNGATIRVIRDHKGASISTIQCVSQHVSSSIQKLLRLFPAPVSLNSLIYEGFILNHSFFLILHFPLLENMIITFIRSGPYCPFIQVVLTVF